MKKTYITPEALTVVLGSSTSILTGSADLHDDGNGNIIGGLQEGNAGGPGLTKESKNVWDEEW
ncbi:MAG: hypothetical protein IJ537_07430 [Bacteroidaceae bacterium]|nr:hypothetical protein [Bacteroidaceae bacterium]MBQ9294332.1 hypothetical protein [Bacteroidaceae bacterium]